MRSSSYIVKIFGKERDMRKTIILFMVIILTIGLAACGGSKDEKKNPLSVDNLT